MKKLVCVLLILVLCISATFALTACNDSKVGDIEAKVEDINTKVDDMNTKIEDIKETIENIYPDNIDFGAIYSYKKLIKDILTYCTEEYYKFNNDGSGVYTYYRWFYNNKEGESDKITHYTLDFKYEYIDSSKTTVMLFYNGITYLDDHNQSTTTDYSTWNKLFTVSKGTIINLDSSNIFYNVDYLKNEYPDFIPYKHQEH